MTLLEAAKKKNLIPLIRKISAQEKQNPNTLLERIKEGRVVILQNKKRKIPSPCAIGLGLGTKINANLGTSTDRPCLKKELEKLKVALKYGADTVMDLSIGGSLAKIRKEIIRHSPVPVGTVPIYETAINAQKRGHFLNFDFTDILETLERQASDGVDFFTVHAGVTLKSIAVLKKRKRILDIVSRGGAILASWMVKNNQENPLYAYFDEILKIAYKYDITLSLGDGLRPGSILDATDEAQISELYILGELAKRARAKNVQVIIEGPGHLPLNEIRKNVVLEKRICSGAPFYVLGPLVTDVAAGYDHINAAIGAAVAGGFGADFLCYVTASEHLRHPSAADVREGVIASRIAAHAADIAKNIKSALDWDKKMSLARKKRDWKKQIALSLDPEKARLYHFSRKPAFFDVCTMCGKYCSLKIAEEYLLP